MTQTDGSPTSLQAEQAASMTAVRLIITFFITVSECHVAKVRKRSMTKVLLTSFSVESVLTLRRVVIDLKLSNRFIT